MRLRPGPDQAPQSPRSCRLCPGPTCESALQGGQPEAPGTPPCLGGGEGTGGPWERGRDPLHLPDVVPILTLSPQRSSRAGLPVALTPTKPIPGPTPSSGAWAPHEHFPVYLLVEQLMYSQHFRFYNPAHKTDQDPPVRHSAPDITQGLASPSVWPPEVTRGPVPSLPPSSGPWTRLPIYNSGRFSLGRERSPHWTSLVEVHEALSTPRPGSGGHL